MLYMYVIFISIVSQNFCGYCMKRLYAKCPCVYNTCFAARKHHKWRASLVHGWRLKEMWSKNINCTPAEHSPRALTIKQSIQMFNILFHIQFIIITSLALSNLHSRRLWKILSATMGRGGGVGALNAVTPTRSSPGSPAVGPPLSLCR